MLTVTCSTITCEHHHMWGWIQTTECVVKCCWSYLLMCVHPLMLHVSPHSVWIGSSKRIPTIPLYLVGAVYVLGTGMFTYMHSKWIKRGFILGTVLTKIAQVYGLYCYLIHLPLSPLLPTHAQLTVYPGVVSVVFNGGWNYPGVEYIWRRIFTEITTDSDKNHSRMPIHYVMCECSYKCSFVCIVLRHSVEFSQLCISICCRE